MRICVAGLWHLGVVTAACVAAAGHRVVAFDEDEAVVTGLRRCPARSTSRDSPTLCAGARGRLAPLHDRTRGGAAGRGGRLDHLRHAGRRGRSRRRRVRGRRGPGRSSTRPTRRRDPRLVAAPGRDDATARAVEPIGGARSRTRPRTCGSATRSRRLRGPDRIVVGIRPDGRPRPDPGAVGRVLRPDRVDGHRVGGAREARAKRLSRSCRSRSRTSLRASPSASAPTPPRSSED